MTTFADFYVKAGFNEDDHPRDETGRFSASDREAVAAALDEAGYGQEAGLQRLGDPVFKEYPDVREWGRSRGVEVDPELIQKMGLENMQVICGTHDDLVAKYPFLEGSVIKLEIGDLAPTALAYSNSNGIFPQTRIALTSQFVERYMNGEKMFDELNKERGLGPENRTRFMVPSDLREVVIHEYGHASHNWMTGQMASSIFPESSRSADRLPYSEQRNPDAAYMRMSAERVLGEHGVLKFAEREAGWVDDGYGVANAQNNDGKVWDRKESEKQFTHLPEDERAAAALLDRLNNYQDRGHKSLEINRAVSSYGGSHEREAFAELYVMHNSDRPLTDRFVKSMSSDEVEKTTAAIDRYRSTVNEYARTFGGSNIL